MFIYQFPKSLFSKAVDFLSVTRHKRFGCHMLKLIRKTKCFRTDNVKSCIGEEHFCTNRIFASFQNVFVSFEFNDARKLTFSFAANKVLGFCQNDIERFSLLYILEGLWKINC